MGKVKSSKKEIVVSLDPQEFISARLTKDGAILGGMAVRQVVEMGIIAKYPQIRGARSIRTTFKDGCFIVTYELEDT